MQYHVLMSLCCEIGSRLAMAGAETYRVEESILRILAAYQLQGRVYCVPNSLIVTLLIPDQPPMTQLCRMQNHTTDLDAVEHYSNLSRRICSQKPDPELAMQWLCEEEIRRRHYPLPMVLLGYIMVAMGFCIFFGGSFWDSLCAGICGLILGIFQRLIKRLPSNIFFSQIASAFLMTFSAYGLFTLGIGNSAEMAIIGTLMLLVPGVLFTNALRDIIFGDTSSGINRIVEMLLIAAGIALGTAGAFHCANFLWGVPVSAPALSNNFWITCATALFACTGFVIVFNIHGKGNLLCALGGGIAWAVYCGVQALGGSSILCFFTAAVVSAAYSEAMARIRKYPAISYLVISLLPLVPGSGIFYTAQYAVQGQIGQCMEAGMQTLAVAGILAVGVLLVSTAVRIFFGQPNKVLSSIAPHG